MQTMGMVWQEINNCLKSLLCPSDAEPVLYGGATGESREELHRRPGSNIQEPKCYFIKS